MHNYTCTFLPMQEKSYMHNSACTNAQIDRKSCQIEHAQLMATGPELLERWKADRGFGSWEQVARALGINLRTLSLYRSRGWIGDLDIASQIEEKTGGAVPASAWRKRAESSTAPPEMAQSRTSAKAKPDHQSRKKTDPEVGPALPVAVDDAAMVELPLLGYIAAGVPIKVQPGLEGSIYVDRTWVGSHPCFALRVTGDSMTGAGIMPHDIVVVRQANSALDGDIVVVTVDGETTLKRYRQKNGKILLVPENPTMAAIELTGGNVQIQGVVVGQIRSYHRPLDAKRTRSKR